MAEQVLVGPSTVMIDGQEYTVRRLGVRDIFPVARLLGIAVANSGLETFEGLTAQDIVKLIIAAVPVAEDDVIKLCASLINVPPKDFGNMPPTALIDVVEKVAEGEDLKAFFGRVSDLADRGNVLGNRAQRRSQSPKRSTESKQDTDGVTTKS